MAHVQQCKYCLRSVVNSPWHPECRLAKLEDLLFRIKERLESGHTKPVSNTLRQEILAETFRSKAEIDIVRQNAEQRRRDKENWDIAHAEALRVASAKFQAEHPDPDSPTC